MKRVDHHFRILAAGLCAGLAVCLVSGCASSASSNRRVYDRYAELVAARNRSVSEGEDAPASASRADPSKSAPAERPSSKAEPVKPAPAKPTPAKPAPVKSAPAKPAAPVEPEARPETVPPPPVQIVAPPPVEKPVVPPAPEATSVPDPVPAPAPEPTPAPVPAPAPEAIPAPMPSPEPISAPAPVAVPVPAPSPAATPAVDERPSAADSIAYLLKVGDYIQITLRGIPSGDIIEDVIDEEGTVTLPLINEVQAAGTTPSELERKIRKIYQDLDIYRNITVTVVVPTRYYFVQGEVRAAGKFQILSATRVSQAIAGAGGYSEYASGRVYVKRGGKIVKDIRNARRLERTPEDDILLEPDDIVEVKRSLW